MNTLVPFKYQGMSTTEAIEPVGMLRSAKQFRMTRKGWGEFFGAKQPQNYMDNLKDKHPDLPEGIPLKVTVPDQYSWGDIDLSQRQVNLFENPEKSSDLSTEKGVLPLTVRGKTGQEFVTKRRREIEIWTLDPFESFEYAVYSELVNAILYVRGFPRFHQAIMEGRITFPKPNPSLEAILLLPKYTNLRGEMVRAYAGSIGKLKDRVWANLRALESDNPHSSRKHGPRKINLKKAEEAKTLFATTNMINSAIARKLDISGSTIGRWRILYGY